MSDTTLPPPDVELTGRFTPEQERRYDHRAFVVPPGARQLHLRYSYSDQVGSDPALRDGNTLDIGLFDERGIAPGSPGFRGWSGSNKGAFTIDRDWATPPYRPGPLGAGRWHVALGPYKVCPRGLDYRVRIWFDLGLPAPQRAPARPGPIARPRLPPAAEPGWLRGDPHCHTLYSDGDSWPEEARLAAAAAGLDFLSVTDHNNANFDYLAQDASAGGGDLPLLIPGSEVTTYGGHWNVWGLTRWFEFRDSSPAATETAMREAAAAGGLVGINHPKPLGPAWEYGDARGYHAIEVWNGPWLALNAVALAFWEERLRRGERPVALGGSDTHRLRGAATRERAPRARYTPRLGQPATWVRVEGAPTAAAILAGLRAGRCFVSASPAGPQLYLAPDGGRVRTRAVGALGAALLLITDRGVAAAEAIAGPDWQRHIPFPPDGAWLRAQLVDGAGSLLALTNPIWRDML
jgi:hypothetical protein